MEVIGNEIFFYIVFYLVMQENEVVEVIGVL